jgi:nucleotide-binding universal stress UspA family protein
MSTSENKTVVVGVDGTSDGDRAVWYASELASREHLDLRLVHVPQEFEMYAPMMPYLPASTIDEIGESVLREAVKHAEEAGFDTSRIGTMISRGPRRAALLRHVDDARCIVLGTRSSAVQHLLTGATTMSVAAHSPVPVHCVPRGWAAGSTSNRVVVGVDGSEADADVLEQAFAEAESLAAELDIVHAWRPVSPYDASITGRTLREDWDKAARDALTRTIEPVAAAHPTVRWALRLEFERVSVALHESSTNARLLVLGRHSHNPLLGLLLGSNTRTLVHSATCPVVVVPVGPASHA